MPRANRYYAPGYVWHITHRCHKREFLLKFSSDRDAYRKWLYEARKRFEGNKGFLEGIREKLGIKVKAREIEDESGKSCLREPGISYEGIFGIENGALMGENMHYLKSI